MMRKYISLFVVVVFSATFFVACKSEKVFRVKGELSSAEEATLFLEHRGLGGIELLDSVKLKKDGQFSFKAPAPQNPEFYQLRIGKQIAVFAVDSTETLQVKGDAKDLFSGFSVENSPANAQIKQVDNKTQTVKKQIEQFEKQHSDKSMDDMAYIHGVDSVLKIYKTEITNLILSNPRSAAAYYAVFQKINDYLIFDPYNKQDYSMFAAVATSWDKFYPQTARTKHLYDFVMTALKVRKQEEQNEKLLSEAPVRVESSMPDIVLSAVNGEKVSLSSLKGKVVVLDFTVYKSEFSPQHNIALNKIYNQNKSRGLEIYQISLDSDVHFWKNAASNLPWITVRDAESVQSQLVAMYNVRNVPTAFILNREGDVVARVENYSTLSAELNKVL